MCDEESSVRAEERRRRVSKHCDLFNGLLAVEQCAKSGGLPPVGHCSYGELVSALADGRPFADMR